MSVFRRVGSSGKGSKAQIAGHKGSKAQSAGISAVRWNLKEGPQNAKRWPLKEGNQCTKRWPLNAQVETIWKL